MTSTIKKSIIVVAISAALSVALYGALSRPGPFCHSVFEVRAIDGRGHPVAGAEVWLDTTSDKPLLVGTTDSFGIWRRNMKLPEGSEARFNFRKRENHRGSVKMEPVRHL